MLVVYHESIALPSPHIKHSWDVYSAKERFESNEINFDKDKASRFLI